MERFQEPILHVDMDAFFVEVERRDDPSLRNRPVVVGGLGARGVVAAASYEARRHGVRSAMPMGEARRRCPGARYLAPDHDRYRSVSAEVFALLGELTPRVEPLSVDEAFLDVSGLRLHHHSSEEVGRLIRRRARTELGLPASVGIAAVKFIAKMASGDAKPDGLKRVPEGTERAYLAPLPVRRLWGVGEATHAALESIGVRTVGELAGTPQTVLEHTVGHSVGAHLGALAAGIDPRPVDPPSVARSVSVEETYPTDLAPGDVPRRLAELCDRLGRRLLTEGRRGHTVVLKVRFEDFSTVTRSTTAARPVPVGDLFRVAGTLWRRVPSVGRGIRLLGVATASLTAGDAPHQLRLDGGAEDPAAEVAEAIRSRFGGDALIPGRLISGRLVPDGPGSGRGTGSDDPD